MSPPQNFGRGFRASLIVLRAVMKPMIILTSELNYVKAFFVRYFGEANQNYLVLFKSVLDSSLCVFKIGRANTMIGAAISIALLTFYLLCRADGSYS